MLDRIDRVLACQQLARRQYKNKFLVQENIYSIMNLIKNIMPIFKHNLLKYFLLFMFIFNIIWKI
jgi:hypothetical protein